MIESFDYGAHYTEMLATVANDVRDRHPGTHVVPWVQSGDPVRTLVDMSRERGTLVVVGKRGLGAFNRVLIGSTSIAVAGRAAGPVVIVPDEWDPPETAKLPIVVGVDFEHANDALLGFAIERIGRFGRQSDRRTRVEHTPVPASSNDERARWMVDAKRRLEEELVDPGATRTRTS